MWIAQVFVDWVLERQGGRFLIGDLADSGSRKFGVQEGYGSAEVRNVLARRVLPYWQACGYLELLEGEAFELTGKANSGPKLLKN